MGAAGKHSPTTVVATQAHPTRGRGHLTGSVGRSPQGRSAMRSASSAREAVRS